MVKLEAPELRLQTHARSVCLIITQCVSGRNGAKLFLLTPKHVRPEPNIGALWVNQCHNFQCMPMH